MYEAPTKVTIFDADRAPVRGLRTRWAEYATGIGFWSLLSNVRWGEDRSIRVRYGSEIKTSGGIGGSTDPKGFWSGVVNGTWMALAAVRVSSETRVYKSTDMASWTEVTSAAASGYEASRFSSDGDVTFEVIRHPEITESNNTSGAEGKDIVIIQNGVDYPRVSNSGVTAFYVHRGISAPTKAGLRPVVMGVDGVASLQASPIGTVFTATGAGITLAASGAVPNRYYRLAITSGVTNGSTALADFTGNSTSMSLTGPFVMIGVETTYTQWLEKVKIEISDDNTNWNSVYDPDDDEGYVYYSVGSSTNRYYYQFPVAETDGASSSVAYVRFTWDATTAEAPGSTQNVDIFFMATVGGGYYDAKGSDLFATCQYNSKSLAMSPGVVVNPSTVGVRLVEYGGADLSGSRLPIVDDFVYRPYVPCQNPNATDMGRGVDHSMFFRKQADESEFRLIYLQKTATYSSGWSLDGGVANSVYRIVVEDDRQPRLPFPTAYHQTIPIGRAMCKSNGHLFVGAMSGSGVSPGVYHSRLDYDFHFLEIPNLTLEDYSPGAFPMAGETVQALIAVSTNIYNNSIVYAFTNKNLYAFTGSGLTDLSKAGRIAANGTISPASVVQHRSAVYWLDNECQMRVVNQGFEVKSLSRLSVDDKFIGIPTARKDDVACGVFKDRIYVAYTPAAGTTNTNILVYNTVTEEWESIDDLPSSINAEFWTTFNDSNTAKLYFLRTDCNVYEHEVEGRTQDLTTGSVAVDMRTGYLHDIIPTEHGQFTVEEIRAVLDRGSANTITTTRTFYPGGGTLTGTLTATSGSGVGWIEDILGTPTGAAKGKACQLKFTGGLLGGSRILMLEADFAPMDGYATST